MADLHRTPRASRLFPDCIAIFQGGGCRASAFAGAFLALTERKVHIAEVAGTSAGSIVAVLIAAGITPERLTDELTQLDFERLLAPPATRVRGRRITPGRLGDAHTLLRGSGLHSTKEIGLWLEQLLRDILPASTRPHVLFRDLPLPVSILATDLQTGRAKTWSAKTTPDDSVSGAVEASCAIPFFFEPYSGHLVDGGLISNLPMHLGRRPLSDQLPILGFGLIDEALRQPAIGGLEIAAQVADAVTRGGQELQQELQPSVHIIEIDTGFVKATDFAKMTVDAKRTLKQSGYAKTIDFLDRETILARPAELARVLTTKTQRFDILADEFSRTQRRIDISTQSTSWVFELFTALFLCRLKGIEVNVTLPQYGGTALAALYQRELLTALGCHVTEMTATQGEPLDCFLFDAEMDRGVVVSLARSGVVDSNLLRRRDGDDALIDLIVAHVLESESYSQAGLPFVEAASIGLETATDEEVRLALGRVDEYRGADIDVGDVELSNIDSWARYALSYKHKQQFEMSLVLRDMKLVPFQAFWVRFASGARSLALPPVVERGLDGRCVIVNGLSRLVLPLRAGERAAPCAVVSSVSTPPPATRVHRLSEVSVILGDREDPGHRYTGFEPSRVRNVERAAHTLESLEPPK